MYQANVPPYVSFTYIRRINKIKLLNVCFRKCFQIGTILEKCFCHFNNKPVIAYILSYFNISDLCYSISSPNPRIVSITI